MGSDSRRSQPIPRRSAAPTRNRSRPRPSRRQPGSSMALDRCSSAPLPADTGRPVVAAGRWRGAHRPALVNPNSSVIRTSVFATIAVISSSEPVSSRFGPMAVARMAARRYRHTRRTGRHTAPGPAQAPLSALGADLCKAVSAAPLAGTRSRMTCLPRRAVLPRPSRQCPARPRRQATRRPAACWRLARRRLGSSGRRTAGSGFPLRRWPMRRAGRRCAVGRVRRRRCLPVSTSPATLVSTRSPVAKAWMASMAM